MDRKAVCIALAPLLFLHACDRSTRQENAAGDDPELRTVDLVGTPGVDPAPFAPPPPSGSRDEANDGYPNPAPAVLTPEAEKSVTGARNVLLSFARAIELKEYDQAWALLSPGDRRKWSKADFAAIFGDMGEITVAIADGVTEGACGSIYHTAPVTITAQDGRPERIEGEAVLRRVNDVPGATLGQRRWHFEKLTLDWPR